MLPTLLLATALSGAPPAAPPPAPLESAIEHYRTIASYRVTIRSLNANGGEHILYYYKKPGFVRMEFIQPHAGALLVYSPDTGRVRLWPFGHGHFPELDLSPGNPLISGTGGQHVDHSDVGALYENVRTLQQHGETRLLGEEQMNGHTVVHIVTTGSDDFTVGSVHRYELWLDAASEFPAKIISRDKHDAILETVLMEDLELNRPYPETLFNP